MLLGLASMACSSATRLYSGPIRPDEKVARLETDEESLFLEIGGRQTEGRRFEVLPGLYDLRISTANGDAILECRAQLSAAAGHRYLFSRPAPTQQPRLEDLTTRSDLSALLICE